MQNKIEVNSPSLDSNARWNAYFGKEINTGPEQNFNVQNANEYFVQNLGTDFVQLFLLRKTSFHHQNMLPDIILWQNLDFCWKNAEWCLKNSKIT